MQWLLMSLLGLLLVGACGLLLMVAERQRQWRLEEKAEHAKCMALISSVTSNALVAARVRDLAERWDQIENQSDLTRISNTKYSPGGPSVVNLWLHEKADQIEQAIR